jgi:hypothetical protein
VNFVDIIVFFYLLITSFPLCFFLLAVKFTGLRAESIGLPKEHLQLRPTGKDKPKPKPEPKPKPKNYFMFSSHVDDATCGDASMIETHGYLIGECFTGTGEVTGLHWSFTARNDEVNYFLDYNFYADDQCATDPVVTSVQVLPYGCAARGNSGGFDRFKNFHTTDKIPKLKGGALFNGYQTQDDCRKGKENQIVGWSFLANGECDPHIYSPVYGPHTTDETRSCHGRDMTADLYDTTDHTCSGTVTTTTPVLLDQCILSSNDGVGAVYQEAACV